MDMLSMKRYELPQPPAGKMTDVAAWQECVDNSQAQLEHQALRILNLEMMADFGIPAWKTYNDTLVSMIDAAQKQLQVGWFESVSLWCVCVGVGGCGGVYMEWRFHIEVWNRVLQKEKSLSFFSIHALAF